MYYDPSGYATERCPPNGQFGGDGVESSVEDSDETKTIRNWKGEEVTLPEGHQMSPKDPDMSELFISYQ